MFRIENKFHSYFYFYWIIENSTFRVHSMMIEVIEVGATKHKMKKCAIM